MKVRSPLNRLINYIALFAFVVIISSCGSSKRATTADNKNSNVFDKKIEGLKINKSLGEVEQKLYVNDYKGA